MILYGAPMPAPNPRRVRIFLAEKGVDLAETPLSIVKGEHKSDEHKARNSLGQVPTLVLDDGSAISETVAICRYIEETAEGPKLFGSTPLEKAEVDMWVRRSEFQLMSPVGMYWRHAHPFTARLLNQYNDFGESNRRLRQGPGLAGRGAVPTGFPGRRLLFHGRYLRAQHRRLRNLDRPAAAGRPAEPEGLVRAGVVPAKRCSLTREISQ
jgi:glutathione S-transferase